LQSLVVLGSDLCLLVPAQHCQVIAGQCGIDIVLMCCLYVFHTTSFCKYWRLFALSCPPACIIDPLEVGAIIKSSSFSLCIFLFLSYKTTPITATNSHWFIHKMGSSPPHHVSCTIFTRVGKTDKTISFIMSVCPRETTWLPLKFDMRIFEDLLRENSSLIKF
jgi:hypothetical protein